MKTRQTVNLCILAALAVLSATGVLRSFQENVILPPAEQYVEGSQEKALAAFITVSIVKGIVAVIEGSDVVGIEVGDLVQPLYDAIDITWRLITLCLASLYILEVLLDLCGIVGQFTTTALLILLILHELLRKETLKKTAFFTGILAAAFFVGIPLTLYVSGVFSNAYSEPTRLEFDRKMDEFEAEYNARLLEMGSADIIDFDIDGSILQPSEFKLDMSFPKGAIVLEILNDMSALIETLPDLLLRTGVTWLLDVIIVPLGMLFLLYKLSVLFTESAFGEARAEKLNRRLKKYISALRRDVAEEDRP